MDVDPVTVASLGMPSLDSGHMVSTAHQGTREMVALNPDIVGYSPLLADDFESTTSAMESLERIVNERVSDSNGMMVNFVGDNFMAVLEDAMEAIEGAIAITSVIESRNEDIPEQKRIRFRMGLDQGQVAVSDGQWFGDVLNIAARIQAIAPPGGISVSGRIYRALDEADLVKERYPAIDVAEWIDRNPYQVEEMVERWKTDLTAVGLIDRPAT